jgi:hypothetical protein
VGRSFSVGDGEETAGVEVELSAVVEVACPELVEEAFIAVSTLEVASGVEVAVGTTTGVEVASSARKEVGQPEKIQARIIRNIIEIRAIFDILFIHILGIDID